MSFLMGKNIVLSYVHHLLFLTHLTSYSAGLLIYVMALHKYLTTYI